MSVSMYEFVAPIFLGGIGAARTVVDKAIAHVKANDMNPVELVEARLYPDMYTFSKQVQNVAYIARWGCDRLEGREPEDLPFVDHTLEQMLERLDAAAERVEGADRAAIDASEDRQFTLDLGAPVPFTGRLYLTGFVVPNFLFHVVTAYDIMRHRGVELGKRDHITPFMMATQKLMSSAG